MRRIAVLSAVAILAACQSSEPGIEVRTVRVPQPVACLPTDQIPAEPAAVGDRLTGDPVLHLPTVAASALALRAALKITREALLACAHDSDGSQ